MLICVAGKNNISVDVLDYLIKNNNGAYTLCIVCNKNETGRNGWQRSLRFFAKKNKVEERMLEDLYNEEDLIFLSLEFDRIIKPELFRTNKLYNIHFSLLPEYKGMYTSAIPILNGEKYVGVTFHKIDRGIDTGDIIDQKRIELPESFTSRDLYLQFIKDGTEIVISNMTNVINNRVVATPQPEVQSTYYGKGYIDYENLQIDINQTASGIQKQVRAFSFREFQMPCIHNSKIIGTYITKLRSDRKPGQIVLKNQMSIMMSTIDYNIVLYLDRFEELMKACSKGDMSKVQEICGVREHINQLNDKGWSPLTVATYNNYIDIAKYLILNGADLNILSNNGTNLLMYAKDAYVNTGNLELFDLYLALGMSWSQEDYNGKNLLQYIEEQKMDLSVKNKLKQRLNI